MAPNECHADIDTYNANVPAHRWCGDCLVFNCKLHKKEVGRGVFHLLSTVAAPAQETFNGACDRTMVGKEKVAKCQRCKQHHHNCYDATHAMDGDIDDTKTAHNWVRNEIRYNLLSADEQAELGAAMSALWEALRVAIIEHTEDRAYPKCSVKKFPDPQELHDYLAGCEVRRQTMRDRLCFLTRTDGFNVTNYDTWMLAKQTFVAKVRRIFDRFRQRQAAFTGVKAEDIPWEYIRFGATPTYYFI